MGAELLNDPTDRIGAHIDPDWPLAALMAGFQQHLISDKISKNFNNLMIKVQNFHEVEKIQGKVAKVALGHPWWDMR